MSLTAVAPGSPAELGWRRTTNWAALVTGGRVAAALLAAVWIAVLARTLHVAAFADLSLLVVLATLVTGLSEGGVAVAAAAQVAASPPSARSVFELALRVRLCLAVPAVVVLALAYGTVSDAPSVAALTLISISAVATMIHQLAIAVLRASGARRFEPVADVAPRAALLAAGATLVATTGIGLVAASSLYAAADVALAAVCLHRVRRAGTASVPDRAAFGWRALWRPGAGLATWMVQQRIAVWFVALLSSPSEVAYFAAAQRLADAAFLPAMGVAAVAVPQVAKAGVDRARRVSAMLVSVAAAAGTPALLAGLFAAPPLARLAFGAELAPSATALRWLLVVVPVAGAGAVLVHLRALAHPRRQLQSTMAALIVLVAACVVLVPRAGASGGAAAVALSELVLVAALGARRS